MKKITHVCPYCGTECRLSLVADNGRDFLTPAPRLTQPMIRYQKGGKFTPVTWEEAIRYTARRLNEIKNQYGPHAIMAATASRESGNETHFLMQKFARAVLRTNNIDGTARAGHGPSAAGLRETLGNGVMSNAINDIENSTCLLMFGYDCAAAHPVVARRVIRAWQNGARIILCDARCAETERIADLHLPLSHGGNMALVNAFGYVLLEEELYDKAYVTRYTEGLDTYREIVKDYAPEATEHLTGLPAARVRQAMRTFAAAPSATIMWGTGVTRSGQALDVVKGLVTLALLTGNLGRESVGVGPVHGQNNLQGACDMGALPDQFPGYQPVSDPAVRAKFARAWQIDPQQMDDQPGPRITEVPRLMLEGKIKAGYMMGDAPLHSGADGQGLSALDFLVVQETAMTQTAAMADVLLPAMSRAEQEGVLTCADRGFRRFEQATKPAGNVKRDWEIISLLATEMGYPMHYDNARQIWDEIRELCPLFYGVTYEKMGEMGHIQWPCPTLDHSGTRYLYKHNHFDTPSGKGRLFAAQMQ